jgi:type II secretory pathway pseudopilin PulG
MEGAIVLLVLLLLAVLILPIIIASNSNAKISKLQNDLKVLKDYIIKINSIERVQTNKVEVEKIVEQKIEQPISVNEIIPQPIPIIEE